MEEHEQSEQREPEILPGLLTTVDFQRHGIVLGPTECRIPKEVPIAVVLRLGQGFKVMGKGWKWWASDTYHWLESNFGPGAGMQLFEESDYADGTIHNIVSVGGRVPEENRVNDLPFSHYEAIATLPKDKQREWVEIARPDPDEGRPLMRRDDLREGIAQQRNRQYAEEQGRTIDEGSPEPPPEPIYRECQVCKDCWNCHGTHRERIA